MKTLLALVITTLIMLAGLGFLAALIEYPGETIMVIVLAMIFWVIYIHVEDML